MNTLLISIIRLFHILIILFVIITPFIKIPILLLLHILFSFNLMLHWYYNSNNCYFSVLESQLRGLKRKETIIYQFIAPIYNVSTSNLNMIIWCITFLLILLSIYNLYYSNKVKYYKNYIINKYFKIYNI